MAATASRHGVRMEPGTDSTATVLGCAAPTLAMRLSVSPDSESDARSWPSPDGAEPNTIATSAALAAATASSTWEPSLYATVTPASAVKASSGETTAFVTTAPEPWPAV